jgi:RNA polymerase sigma factor (sigma-70 family)
MPKEMQLKRIRRAIAQELTASQREILLAYHVQGMNIPQIAAERGVYKSTVSRTLKRAEDKLRRYLKY